MAAMRVEGTELRESLRSRTRELQAAREQLVQAGAELRDTGQRHSLDLTAWEAERGGLEAVVAGLRHDLKGAHESHEAEAMMAGRYAEALSSAEADRESREIAMRQQSESAIQDACRQTVHR
eukprot:SAG25_NODE_2783_length_1385_cov_1.599533_1_plen_122_part_00